MRDLIKPYISIYKLIIFAISKFKQLIQTIQHDLHIRMCLKTKFKKKIFFFNIYWDVYKIVVFRQFWIIEKQWFSKILKNIVSNFPKNVKCVLWAHFNMEIMWTIRIDCLNFKIAKITYKHKRAINNLKGFLFFKMILRRFMEHLINLRLL